MMQTWRSDTDTGLGGRGLEKEALKREVWYKMGLEYGAPFDIIFSTMDPKSPIWHNRLGYWPTKPWDGKGLVTLAGDSAHPMTFHRGQGLNNAITDAADLLQHLRAMKEKTPAELRLAVLRYEHDLFLRGKEAVLASNENTNAVHDWATVLKSPLFTGGLTREGDKIEVDESKKFIQVRKELGGASLAVPADIEGQVAEEIALEKKMEGFRINTDEVTTAAPSL